MDIINDIKYLKIQISVYYQNINIGLILYKWKILFFIIKTKNKLFYMQLYIKI